MNRHNQWLFEAPFVLGNQREYYQNSEWESAPTSPTTSRLIHKPRVLRVPFKTSFPDFRREVERAVGRWTVFRSDRGTILRKLLEPSIGSLRTIHQQNLDLGTRSGEPVDIIVNFYYTGRGKSLRVFKIVIFPPEIPVIQGSAPSRTNPPNMWKCTVQGVSFLCTKKPCTPSFTDKSGRFFQLVDSSESVCRYAEILTR
jgi:hypothetical protein